jgi:hypothetical protein
MIKTQLRPYIYPVLTWDTLRLPKEPHDVLCCCWERSRKGTLVGVTTLANRPGLGCCFVTTESSLGGSRYKFSRTSEGQRKVLGGTKVFCCNKIEPRRVSMQIF